MGYYTAFRLSVKNVRSLSEYTALREAVKPFGVFDLDLELEPGLELKLKPQPGLVIFYSSDTYKWYHFEKDMDKLSQEFPHMTFMLEGDGEDYDDYWIEYFQDGNHELCVGSFTYPDPVTIPWNDIPNISIPEEEEECEQKGWSQVLNGAESE